MHLSYGPELIYFKPMLHELKCAAILSILYIVLVDGSSTRKNVEKDTVGVC